MEGVYLCGVWEDLGEKRNFWFYFHVEILCFFLFLIFKSVLLNGGTLFINCNIAPKASVLKQGLAFSDFTENTSIPRVEGNS